MLAEKEYEKMEVIGMNSCGRTLLNNILNATIRKLFRVSRVIEKLRGGD